MSLKSDEYADNSRRSHASRGWSVGRRSRVRTSLTEVGKETHSGEPCTRARWQRTRSDDNGEKRWFMSQGHATSFARVREWVTESEQPGWRKETKGEERARPEKERLEKETNEKKKKKVTGGREKSRMWARVERNYARTLNKWWTNIRLALTGAASLITIELFEWLMTLLDSIIAHWRSPSRATMIYFIQRWLVKVAYAESEEKLGSLVN